MSRHRRGRITVQHQPAGASRVMMRMMGVIHGVIGLVFVVISLTEIIPNTGLFGLPFLLAGGFFTVNGVLLAIGKNGFARRIGYDVETDVEEETIVGLMDEVPPSSSAPETHDHIPSTAPNAQKRLEQLESLKNAGLVTDQEYREKRREILREL